jgi:hypothetical protein
MYAFPSGHNPKTGTQESGMTLRDYFAAAFLSNNWCCGKTPEDAAIAAYAYADALMIARDE